MQKTTKQNERKIITMKYTSRTKRTKTNRKHTKNSNIARKDKDVAVIQGTPTNPNPIKDEAISRIASGDQTPYDLLVLAIAIEALEDEFSAHHTTLEWRDHESGNVRARLTSTQ